MCLPHPCTAVGLQMGSYCWEWLIFPQEVSPPQKVTPFSDFPILRFMSHASADSSALQCPGDPYLPPGLQSAQKLVMEVGKEAGWLTLQLLEIKQWKWDRVINSRKTNIWCKLQSACSAQLRNYLMRTHACWIFRQTLAEYMDFWNYNKRIYSSAVDSFSNGMNYLQNSCYRAQYKNQIRDTLLNQYCLLKSVQSSKATTKKHLSTKVLQIHNNYQKLAPNIFNPPWVHEKTPFCALFSSTAFKVNHRTHANIACLNAKDISTGNLYQLWHNSDSAEQGAVKT